ncbi:hypothetical protein [Inconstantimicrobium mannanitabidum]|uniref:Uncharacterized protein n=1 Tax=Inconstantimicrobium mannanitabidum TaxID=1604901 RepID=A0ACB5REV8_9CLOT|nr:hypothetical protein [Clostridium sp. TW13]GKX67755.1 hypothetical protein rsdtw13_30130 [Clostridium sp. TW13]
MESYRELFDAYFIEVNNIADLLSKYVNSYRLLIGTAGELNGIALARKKEVRAAIDRANQLGEIIDVLLDAIQSIEICYLNYIMLKADLIAVKTQKNVILTEVDNELLFQNSSKRPLGNNDRRESRREDRNEDDASENDNDDNLEEIDTGFDDEGDETE